MPRRKYHYQTVKKAVRDSETKFTANEVFDALSTSLLQHLQVGALDSTYWAISADAWEKVIAYSIIDRKQYKSERYDCDNFAIALAGHVATKWDINGCGIVLDWSGAHAYSVLLVNDDGNLSVAVVEPQSDEIILKTEGMYAAKSGLILLA